MAENESPSSTNAELLAKAQRLMDKQLFVKAAEIYQKLGMYDKAASAFESGGAWESAAALFDKLGKSDDAKRCRQKLEEEKSQTTWEDLQANFQTDYPG